jgi:hypothetical protein
MILRSSYTRKLASGKRIHVPASCISDLGATGKGFKNGKGIGTLKKGLLSHYGYSSMKNVSDRHAALAKAVSAYGPLSVLRKLNAVAVYSRRVNPGVSAIFKADMAWVRSSYKFKTDK